jgi:soluble lytic murein transglycosylase
MRFFTLFLLAACLAAPAQAGDKDFLAARDAAHKQQSSKFEKAAKRVREPLFEPYLDFWRIQLAPPGKRDALREAFLRQHADTFLADRLRGDQARAVGKRQDWPAFRTLYPSVVNRDAELECHALLARVEAGEDAARREAARLWFTGRDRPEACTPLFERLFADATLGQEDLWTRLTLALDARQTGVARALAARLPIEEAPEAQAIARALSQASAFLHEADASTRGARLLLLAALARVAADDLDRAYAAWQGIAPAYPEAERGRGWATLGAAAARRHDARALGWFTLAGGGANDEQRAWQARAALRAQDWSTVARAIETMSREQAEQPVWRYWRARAWKALGGRLPASQAFSALARERHYYGQLAEDELGVFVAAPVQPSVIAPEHLKTVGASAPIARAFKLRELGLASDAVNEWRFGTRALDDAHLLAAAELARRADWHDRAMLTAEQVKNLDAVELRFLAPYRDRASEYVRQHGLDEAWVYGLMRQESRFQNHARSGVGASGLMQIMPATGRWIAQRLGMRRFDAGSLYDLDTNLRFGAYYLKYTLDKLGHPVLATAAYNAGPRRALNWQALAPMEGAIYVESIPFLETREYVKKVMYNAMHYAQRFGQPRGGLRERLGVAPARAIEPPVGDANAPQLADDEATEATP